MSSKKKPTKTSRSRYSPAFKVEALGLAEQVGVSGAAKQLGLPVSQLSNQEPQCQRLAQSLGI